MIALREGIFRLVSSTGMYCRNVLQECTLGKGKLFRQQLRQQLHRYQVNNLTQKNGLAYFLTMCEPAC